MTEHETRVLDWKFEQLKALYEGYQKGSYDVDELTVEIRQVEKVVESMLTLTREAV